jgi:hypothetical protein
MHNLIKNYNPSNKLIHLHKDLRQEKNNIKLILIIKNLHNKCSIILQLVMLLISYLNLINYVNYQKENKSNFMKINFHKKDLLQLTMELKIRNLL